MTKPTYKQLEYIAFLASGYSTKQAAQTLVVSHHTIRNTIVKAKERTNAVTTNNLIAMCVENGWLEKREDGPPMTFRIAT